MKDLISNSRRTVGLFVCLAFLSVFAARAQGSDLLRFGFNRQPITLNTNPVVSDLSPRNGETGSIVTIRGFRLDLYGDNPIVSFNNSSPATILSKNNNFIVVMVPQDATDGPVTINGLIDGELMDSKKKNTTFRVKSTRSLVEAGWEKMKNRGRR